MPQPKNLHKKILRRLAPLYAAAFLHGLVFWYAIEKLFMHQIGFNDAGIGVMAAAYSAAMLLFETPSGILADRWSRKGVLILASVALAISSLLAGISLEPALYIVSAVFWGIFYALYSGTNDSIVYDVLVEETGDGNRFATYFGYVSVLDSAALVLGALLGGALSAWVGIRLTYFITIGSALLAIVFLWRFREPLLHKAEALSSLKQHITDTFKAVLGKRQLVWLVVVLVAVDLIDNVLYEFSQLWLIATDVPVALYGPAFAGLLAMIGIGGYVAGRIKARRSWVAGAFVAIGLSSVVLASMHQLWAIIAAQVAMAAATNVLDVFFLNDLHDQLPSRVRAGASSAISTMARVGFIPLSLAFGWISTTASVFVSAWLLAGLLVAAVIFELLYRRELTKRRPAV